MKQINSVMDGLKKVYDKLEKENAADRDSISDKESQIKQLREEIDKLRADIDKRTKTMKQFEQKISETEAYAASIAEVESLIDESEPEEKEEPIATMPEELQEPIVPEEEVVTPGEAIVPEDNSLGNGLKDLVKETEVKEDDFAFKNVNTDIDPEIQLNPIVETPEEPVVETPEVQLNPIVETSTEEVNALDAINTNPVVEPDFKNAPMMNPEFNTSINADNPVVPDLQMAPAFDLNQMYNSDNSKGL